MDTHTTFLRCVELRWQLQEMCAQSHSLCEESRALCAQAQQIKSPWSPPPHPSPQQATPHEMAMEALRLIRSIIDPFPLEWQVAIVKALTARTLIMAHERTRPAPAVLSA